METVIAIIITLGAICACLNVYKTIVDNKPKEKIEQKDGIIVIKKDGTVLDFDLTEIQIDNKQKLIIKLKDNDLT